MMNFLKKKSFDIYYDIYGGEEVRFEDCCKIKHKPEWWKTLPTYIDKMTAKDFFMVNPDKVFAHPASGGSRKTIKACPGMNGFLSQRMLVSFPSDCVIETSSTGVFRWKTFVGGFDVNEHPPHQLIGSHIANNHIVIKFSLPLLFQSDNNRWLFQDCLTEKVQPFRCMNGFAPINSVNRLSVICLFPKVDEKYFFEKGEPMCSVLFLDKFKNVSQRNLQKEWARVLYEINSTMVV